MRAGIIAASPNTLKLEMGKAAMIRSSLVYQQNSRSEQIGTAMNDAFWNKNV
jgi:hypothetical protein